MAKPTAEDLEKIAHECHEYGVKHAEAFPIRKWRKNGWPEDELSFKVVDAYLSLFRLLEKLPGE